jgi:hypothetical protein
VPPEYPNSSIKVFATVPPRYCIYTLPCEAQATRVNDREELD